MKMEIKENMKMYDLLFELEDKMESKLKVTFTNEEGKPFTLSKEMMKKVYDFLNQPIELNVKLHDMSRNDYMLEEDKQKQKEEAISAMKEAVTKRKGRKLDIDPEEVVRLKDELGISFYKIAKRFGCTNQTIINRYNEAKGK